MKICIINLSDGRFIRGQRRLELSLRSVGYQGDILFWSTLPTGWPTQSEAPMAFKAYAFEEAKLRGYDIAIWLDASCIAIRPLAKIISIIERKGIFAFSRLHARVGEWSSDIALTAMSIDREDAMEIPELVTCVLGVDLRNKLGQKFVTEFKVLAEQKISFLGLTPPYTYLDSLTNDKKILSADARVQGHRHDQTVASILVNTLGIVPEYKYCFDYIGEATKGELYARYIPLDTIILQNRDIKNEENYLERIDRYRNKKGINKLLQMIWNSIKSVERASKDWIKFHFLYKKRYPILQDKKYPS